jgi:hypothetical protein
MSVSGIYVPPRYRVRFNANFKPALPVQVETDLLPSGVFGIQDGRTPRCAEPAKVLFDQKTGEMSLKTPGDEPMVLDPVSLRDLSIGIGQRVSISRALRIGGTPFRSYRGIEVALSTAALRPAGPLRLDDLIAVVAFPPNGVSRSASPDLPLPACFRLACDLVLARDPVSGPPATGLCQCRLDTLRLIFRSY